MTLKNQQQQSQQRNSFTGFGPKVWNCFSSQYVNCINLLLKSKSALFFVLETEYEYVEAPALLLKMNSYLKLHRISNLSCLMPLHLFS